MELKTYLRILIKKWWLVLPIFAMTFGATYRFTLNQPFIYESVTTFVMRPRTAFIADDKELASVVDTLSRRVEINATYAEVATSKLIKKRAIERLDLSSQKRKGLSVKSKVIAGTNILQISVQGMDPVVVRDFANAVSVETVNYISNLYDVFELEPLDAAEVPKKPISPKRTLNLAMGGVLGLILGVVLAFLTTYLLESSAEPINFNIIDYETGTYNKPYFMLRLRQETSRAKRNGYQFSLALMKIGHHGMLHRELLRGASSPIPAEALRRITTLLEANLRDEDVMTRFDDATFAFLLPDMPGRSAAVLLEELRIKIGATPLNLIETKTKLNLQGVVGIATYEDHSVDMDELLAQAIHALRAADNTTCGAVSLFSRADTDEANPQNGKTPLAEYLQRGDRLS